MDSIDYAAESNQRGEQFSNIDLELTAPLVIILGRLVKATSSDEPFLAIIMASNFQQGAFYEITQPNC